MSWETATEVKVLNPIKETHPQKGRDVEIYTYKNCTHLYTSVFCVGLYMNDYILGGGYFYGLCILHKELS